MILIPNELPLEQLNELIHRVSLKLEIASKKGHALSLATYGVAPFVSFFHLKSEPSFTIETFVRYLANKAQYAPIDIIAMCIYIDRFLQWMTLSPKRIFFEPKTAHRIVAVALLMADKYVNDRPFNNKSYSTLTNIPLHQLNQLEIEFLFCIRYNLALDDSLLNRYYFSFVPELRASTMALSVVACPVPAIVLTSAGTPVQKVSSSTQRPQVQALPDDLGSSQAQASAQKRPFQLLSTQEANQVSQHKALGSSSSSSSQFFKVDPKTYPPGQSNMQVIPDTRP